MLGLFTPDAENPWAELPQGQYRVAASALLALAAAIEAHAQKLQALQDFAQSARKTAKLLVDRPELYEQITYRRALVATTPRLHDSVTVWEGLITTNPDAAITLLAEIQQTAAVFNKTFQDMLTDDTQRVVENITVDLEVAQEQNVNSIPDVIAETKKSWWDTGTLGDMVNTARTAPAAAAGVVQGTVVEGAKGVSDVVARRAGAAINIATISSSNAVRNAISSVTSPITTRVTALGKATGNAVENAAFESVLLSIVFPPAAPFLAALAVLDAASEYSDILAQEQSDAAQIKTLRAAGANEDMARALATWHNQPLLRFETPHLSAEMSVQDRTFDAIVLSGKHTGQHLSRITAAEIDLLIRFAPDHETKQLLEKFQHHTQ